MHFESHATPTKVTPHQRYAALHRAIERGLTSDAIWKELSEVSYQLGHVDEAARCVSRVQSDRLRLALESRLARLTTDRAGSRPARAPAASDAGSASAGPRPVRASHIISEAEEEDGVRGHVVDAVQFLLHQHMPWLCLLTMLAFPLVIGLGGFLTSGTSAVALAAISALPGICVCAVIFAMGRRILLDGSQGVVDAPPFPEVRQLAAEALRFARDLMVVGLAIALPLGAAVWLELSWIGLIPLALLAMAAGPMAFCMRALRGDSAALSPLRNLRAVCRGGGTYVAVAAICWTMLLPFAAVVWYVSGQPVWLQIAAAGPTAVLPVFLAMRLLGTWIDANRQAVGELLGIDVRAESEPQNGDIARVARRQPARPAARPPAATAPPRTPATPARQPRPRPQARAQRRPQPARPVQHLRQAQPESQPPRPGKPARPQPAPAPAREPDATGGRPARGLRSIEGRGPRQAQLEDSPDLASMPGAVTVSGAERVRSGAAARR